MANSSANRQHNHHHHHHHHHHYHQSADLNSATPVSIAFNGQQQRSPKGQSNQFGHHFRRSDGTPASHHNVASSASSSTASPSAHFKGHQRRQSVARLLPDISKLRLLSWLVEASNELINCDIAIMDGVYAKLNRSRESLLFWQHGATNQTIAMGSSGPIVAAPTSLVAAPATINSVAAATAPSRPPPPPSVQPVANKFVISQKKQQQQKPTKSSRTKLTATAAASSQHGARTHHSLPSANYDATSLAAVSWRSSKTMPADSSSGLEVAPTAGTPNVICSNKLLARNKKQQSRKQRQSDKSVVGGQPMQRHSCDATGSVGQQNTGNDNANWELLIGSQQQDGEEQQQQEQLVSSQLIGDDCDSNQSDDDANSSTASSSTTSSGIHAPASLSSESSSSASSSSMGSFFSNSFDAQTSGATLAATEQTIGCGSSIAGYSISAAGSGSIGTTCSSSNHNSIITGSKARDINLANFASSADYLSERIRQTVMEHNYLQSLLVNIIRQHDKRRDSFNQHRKQTSANSMDRAGLQQQYHQQNQQQMPRIDLADIADLLDDGCQCSCHTERRNQACPSDSSSFKLLTSRGGNLSAAATPTSSSLNLFQPTTLALMTTPTPRKTTRRSKKIRDNSEPSREDMIQQLADKLCENCFETHYWLQGCHSIELTPNQNKTNKQQDSSMNNGILVSQQQSTINQSDLNAIVSLRNATFIKLVQQQVRSTISKSIELIDLIRKEIKSPESIKQKQLMRCFSSSIQLLSSVANYVVPSQDISSFIPEVEQQQQTSLFNLPPNDFDHLLLYPTSSSTVNAPFPATFQISQNSPSTNYHLAAAPEIPPRRRQLIEVNNKSDQNKTLSSKNSYSLPARQRANNSSQFDSSKIQRKKDNLVDEKQEQTLNLELQRLKTNDNVLIKEGVDSSSGASSNNSSASSSIARGQVQQSSLTRASPMPSAILDRKPSHDLSFETITSLSKHNIEDDLFGHARPKFWQSSKFNFIKKLLHVKQQRLLRQQSKDRRIYNNKVQNKFRLVMMDLTHFNKSQQLLTTENGVNSLLTSMRNVLEFGLYLTLKLY